MNEQNPVFPRAFQRLIILLLGLAAVQFTMHRAHADELVHSYVVVTVPFTTPQEDHFYCPHQLVTVSLQKDAGSPVIQGTFLFDTGSNISGVSAAFVRKLGGDQFLAQGSIGKQSSLLEKPAWVQVPSVQVGDLEV